MPKTNASTTVGTPRTGIKKKTAEKQLTSSPTHSWGRSGGAQVLKAPSTHGCWGRPTAGRAAEARGKSGSGGSSAWSGEVVSPAVPTVDRSALAGAEYGIGRRLAMRDYQGAVESAAKFWGVEGLAGPAQYGGTSLDEPLLAGLTTRDSVTGATNVTIYDLGMSDARELLSTMYHEGRVHVDQCNARSAAGFRWASESDRWGTAVNEVEAYGAELALSRQLGLSDTQIAGIRGNYGKFMNDVIGTRFESTVKAGNFSLRVK